MNVGIIGSGTMGSGIAMAMLNAGMPVVLIEQNEKVSLKQIFFEVFFEMPDLYFGSWHLSISLY